MLRHETPESVAQVLARYTPKSIKNLLEPSVGTGVLLTPLVNKLKSIAQSVTCVDIDSDVLSLIEDKFRPLVGTKLRVINQDFLRWSSNMVEKFDCIVMNPPYAARKQEWVSIEILNKKDNVVPFLKYVPLEIAFVIRAIELLEDGGRLLAVLPSSVVSSQVTSWFRKYLIEVGKVRLVHELPKYTFPNVESRIYLFVFEKGKEQKQLILWNHELLEPHQLIVSKNDFMESTRLDYGYYEVKKLYNKLIKLSAQYQWTPLEECSTLIRGTVDSSDKRQIAIHSTHFKSGFWSVKDNSSQKGNSPSYPIKRGDIMVRRVGRNCSQSFSLMKPYRRIDGTDCVIIIRPRMVANTSEILFAIRVLMASSLGARLTERGTGASYISLNDLKRLLIPLNISKCYPEFFNEYTVALKQGDFATMLRIEKQLSQTIDSIPTLHIDE